MSSSCTHTIAWPPPGASRQAVGDQADLDELELQPARNYPFALDEFQRVATSCIDRGESVLVCAHTSAGKTVCAQHAIAAALRDGQRVIYSSPIKALSNQKFRELQAELGDVGLVTGDTTINAEASCLVMTTEVLRVMLYRGATTMREVKWVIFDEMHLLGSADRGWVLEESLILLPHSVRVVLLSATVPNASEVAEWLAHLHKQPVHVVHTSRRPVPLRHYVCPLGGSGLHLVQDEMGRFDEAQWQSAVGGLPKPKGGPKPPPDLAADPKEGVEKKLKRAAEVLRVVGRLAPLGMLPAIVFCFSRKECELIATQMARASAATADAPAADDYDGDTSAGAPAAAAAGLSLLRADEVASVEDVFESAMRMLSDEDRELAQVRALLPLLRTGVGVHHSGLLPVLRELVELLFAEGLLRVLIATETLAMGLNLPARTVLFTATSKFDGRTLRLVRPTEYTQMAGRAGRRGLDAQGYSVLLLSHHLPAEEGEEMLSTRFDDLNSRFALRFSTMLKLLRTEGASALTVLTRTFHNFQSGIARRQRAARRHTLTEQLRILDEAAALDAAVHEAAEGYLLQRAALHRLAERFEVRMCAHAKPWLQPGRVLRLHGGRGWAVLVSAPGLAAAGGGMSAAGSPLADSTPLLVLARAARKRPRAAEVVKQQQEEGAIGAEGTTNDDLEAAEMMVVSVPLSAVQHLAATRLWMPRDLQEADARASVALALDASLVAFDGSLPLLDPIEHMRVAEEHDPELLGLIDALEAAEQALRAHPLHRSPELAEPYERCRRRRMLRLELAKLEEAGEVHASPELSAPAALGVLEQADVARDPAAGGRPLAADPRVRAMRVMLERLEYVDADDVLVLKGRAACCVEAADELLLVEVMVNGVLNELSAAETVAVLACMLPGQRADPAKGTAGPTPLRLPTPALDRAVQAINQTLERLAGLAAECGVEPPAEAVEGADKVSTELIPAVLAWASGSTFEQCWLLSPNTFEGTLVRHLKALDEMLLQLADAASALGNQPLRERFHECVRCLHRGIPFANSLYLAEETE